MTHIGILKMTIPKPKSRFSIPEISLEQTIKLIKGMKTSNLIRHDLASIRVYKMLVYRLGPHITFN